MPANSRERLDHTSHKGNFLTGIKKSQDWRCACLTGNKPNCGCEQSSPNDVNELIPTSSAVYP